LLGEKISFLEYLHDLQKHLKSRAKSEGLAAIKDALATFSPANCGNQKERQGISNFIVKTELYRFPSNALHGLCCYYGLPPVSGSLERIKQLYSKGYLSRVNAHALTDLIEKALELRFRTHLHYGTEQEDLYHPDRVNNTSESNPFRLTDEFVQADLHPAYITLFGLESGLQDFLAGHISTFSKSSLIPCRGHCWPKRGYMSICCCRTRHSVCIIPRCNCHPRSDSAAFVPKIYWSLTKQVGARKTSACGTR